MSLFQEEAQSCTFDKTQWERTRFAAEAVNDKKSAEPENKAQMKEETMRRESALLGESRQSVAVKGEYLTRKPMPTIVVLFTELVSFWMLFALSTQ
ncbi:unnamed protein product [Heligmosomoides polygyrus]|uniref:Peptide ABC transporter permease n=1 Tax=Heligmosomoides polygyrus TaxID=6339 RepID=A0A183GN01_HELPZ|nr:unnamed protein product [Heligmosomoides polygyrus]